MRTKHYRVPGGYHIAGACYVATKVARTERVLVRFNFNDIVLTASPKKSPYTLVAEFSNLMSHAGANYRLSEKGQQDAVRRYKEIRFKQITLDTMLENIDGALTTLDGTVNFLNNFVEPADDCGVEFDMAALAAKLEAAGYVRGEHVGQKPEWFNTKERMGRYIVGQAIECLRRGMPPHPILTNFANKYRTLQA